MNARTKFLVGGAIVVSTSGFLMWNATKESGQYYVFPGEYRELLARSPQKAQKAVWMAGHAVPGTIVRDPGGLDHRFRAAHEKDTINVSYHGIAPDTFIDGVEVVVEGKLDASGTFVATQLTTKCASRYESAPPGMPPARANGAGGA